MTDKMHDDKALFNQLLQVQRSVDYTSYLDGVTIEFEPVAGDRIVGKLEEIEIPMYRNLIGIEARIEDVHGEVMAEINTDLANSILEHGGDVNEELMQQMMQHKVPADLAEEYFYLETLRRKVHSEFWFGIRYRLQTFATRLDIRAGYSIVTLGLKYQPK